MCDKTEALKVRREAVRKAEARMASGFPINFSITDEALEAVKHVGEKLAQLVGGRV
jgi:hypothetical protein